MLPQSSSCRYPCSRPLAVVAQVSGARPGPPLMAAAAQELATNGGPSGRIQSSDRFVRNHLKSLKAYVPIEPFEILSARLGRRPEDIVKMDANENPYGPPPEVHEALSNLQFPHIYPDPESRRLREALANYHDVPMENLLVRFWCTFCRVVTAHMRCCISKMRAFG